MLFHKLLFLKVAAMEWIKRFSKLKILVEDLILTKLKIFYTYNGNKTNCYDWSPLPYSKVNSAKTSKNLLKITLR